MYEQVFRNRDDTLREDDGRSSELHYIEQTSRARDSKAIRKTLVDF